jgi:molybdenum cofactor cytidylyltransferase
VTRDIAAIILAAGESRRMGQPKLILPWGEKTVIGQVVETFASAGIEIILVITGGAREPVEAQVVTLAKQYPVQAIYNPKFTRGGMLSSIQAGLAALDLEMRAALIGLGDQPQVQEETIRRITASFLQTKNPLVIPSYQGHRGHPWLVARLLWSDILALPPSATPRQFLHAHSGQIDYVAAGDSILKDLDTQDDYKRQRP